MSGHTGFEYRYPKGERLRLDNRFDGDYTSLKMGIDNKQASWFKRMAPYTGLMDLTTPYRISGNPKTSAPVLDKINNMLEVKELECVPYGE